MALRYLAYGAVAAAAGAVFVGNIAHWFIPEAKLATLEYLSKAQLQTVGSNPKNFTEAEGLASLLPEMAAHGVQLYAVVHETLGAEDFQPFIQAPVYWDIQRKFYGPEERWFSLISLFSYSALRNFVTTAQKGAPEGNLKGEGRLMGVTYYLKYGKLSLATGTTGFSIPKLAVFVIGPGSQGIVFQHHEEIYGDTANLDHIRAAIKTIHTTT